MARSSRATGKAQRGLQSQAIRRSKGGRTSKPASHKGDKAWTLAQACGAALLVLPDLDPIEMVFAKALLSEVEGLRHLLREAGERTRDDLWDRIGRLVDGFPPNHAETTSATLDTLTRDHERF